MLPATKEVPSGIESLIVAVPSTLPVLPTVIVYVILSPSLATVLFPTIWASFSISKIGLYAVISSGFVSVSPTTAVLVIWIDSPSNSLIVTVKFSSTVLPAGTFTLFHVITFCPSESATV